MSAAADDIQGGVLPAQAQAVMAPIASAPGQGTTLTIQLHAATDAAPGQSWESGLPPARRDGTSGNGTTDRSEHGAARG